jgi:hypothetical protein
VVISYVHIQADEAGEGRQVVESLTAADIGQ